MEESWINKKLELITTHLTETRAEALRAVTLTGQRLLQEQEAVSDDDDNDDDDDEGGDTVSGEKRRVRRVGVRRESVRRVRLGRVRREGDESEFEQLVSCIKFHTLVLCQPFCRNEIKDRKYRSVQQHISISFSFSGKKGFPPLLLDVIFVGNFPHPPP